MKLRKYLLTLMMSMFALVVAPVCAQDEDVDTAETAETADMEDEESEDEEEGKSKKKKKKSKKDSKSKKAAKSTKKGADDEASAGTPAVPAALAKFKQLNGKPNMKADYYIYMYSASWCGYCVQCMPVAMDAYKKMKSSRKVELVIINGDKSEGAAKDYLKKYRAKCPSIMFDALQATKFQGLPGCGMPGFPAISVVDKEGKMITSAVGAGQVKEILNNWRAHTIGGKK